MNKNISKKNVICDTMIWYLIGDKKISVPDKNKFQLVATFINLHELLYSTRILYNFNYLQNACRAIFDSESERFCEEPLVYLHNIANPNNKIKPNDDYIRAIDFIASLDNNIFPVESKVNFEKLIKEYHQNTKDSFIIPALMKIEQHHSVIKECKEKVEMNMNNIKIRLHQCIKNNFPDFIIQNKDFWKEIELFLYSYKEFFLKKIHKNNATLENNDKNDLLNLVYVYKDSLYWTKDNDVLDIINQAGYGKYLFKP